MKSNPPSNEALASMLNGLFGVVHAVIVSQAEIGAMVLTASNIPDSPAKQVAADSLVKMLEAAKDAMATFNEVMGIETPPAGIRSGMN